MVWTYLRACYKFNMRLFVGGIEQIYPARWFFCDPDALIFPSPHGAEASPWLKSFEVNDEWGEVEPYKGLDRGINPGYPGQCFVGDPSWFLDGQLPASIATYSPPVVTPCCGHVPPANTDPRCPQPTTVGCARCIGGLAALRYVVTATGGTGDYAILNGTYILVNDAPCAWGHITPDGAHSENFRLTSGFVLGELAANYAPVGLVFAEYAIPLVGLLDCLHGPISLPFISGFAPTGGPPSYSVSPA